MTTTDLSEPVTAGEVESLLAELKVFTNQPEELASDEFISLLEKSKSIKTRVVEAFDGGTFSREKDQLIDQITLATWDMCKAHTAHIMHKYA